MKRTETEYGIIEETETGKVFYGKDSKGRVTKSGTPMPKRSDFRLFKTKRVKDAK